MLRDRRELIEKELKDTRAEAADLYLRIVRDPDNQTMLSVQYSQLRERIGNLEYDLKIINELINQGHK
jgi:hypothetical protein